MKNFYLTIFTFSLQFISLTLVAQYDFIIPSGSASYTQDVDFSCGDNFSVDLVSGDDDYTITICPDANTYLELSLDYNSFYVANGGTTKDDIIKIYFNSVSAGNLQFNSIETTSGSAIVSVDPANPNNAGTCIIIVVQEDAFNSGQTDLMGTGFINGTIGCFTDGDAANDDPCGAQPISVFGSCSPTTVSNYYSSATNPVIVADPSGCVSITSNAGYAGYDVWYTVEVPADGIVDFSTTAGTITDAAIAIYSSSDNTCNGAFTQIACDDDAGPSLMPATSINDINLAGQTLWIRFWDYGGNLNGDFSVCATGTVDCSTPTSNDCRGAIPLCSNTPVSDLASGQGCEADLNTTNDGCLVAGEHNTSWFYFHMDLVGDGTWGFEGVFDVGSNGIEYDWALWQATGNPTTSGSTACDFLGEPIRCSFATQTGKSEVGMGMNASETDYSEGSSPSGNGYTYWLDGADAVSSGEWYILMVDRYSTAGGAFTLNFSGEAALGMDCAITVLPVEWVSFTGEAFIERNVLNWITGSEINNDFFTIQKSQNGSSWENLGIVDGAGSSSSENSYRFVDNENINGMNYYRIVQTDFDGTEKISEIISLKNNFGDPFGQIFPNPTKSEFSFDYNGESTNAVLNVTIIDNAGRQVISEDLTIQLTNTIDVSSLNVGVYTVVLESNEGKFFRKLVRD